MIGASNIIRTAVADGGVLKGGSMPFMDALGILVFTAGINRLLLWIIYRRVL